MSLENLSQEELSQTKPTIEQILAMKTEAIDPTTGQTVMVPDTKAQAEALVLIREVDAEENRRAVAEQNEFGKTKVCYGRPVAGVEGSIYDAFMHTECGDPDWVSLMINDTNRNAKCIGCGGTIGRN